MDRVVGYIARRYLLTKRSMRFINVIGVVSIVGITVGVAALVVALSVFNGFTGVVTAVLLGFDPHLRVERSGGISAAQAEEVLAVLGREPQVVAAAPFVASKAMLVSGSFNQVVVVRGVDAAKMGKVSGLADRIVLGSLAFGDGPGIVLGLTLADRLAAVVGDEVTVISPADFQSSLSGLSAPRTWKFKVVGIFESNNKEYDANYAYVDLAAAGEMFRMEQRFSGVDVRLTAFDRADAVKEAALGRLGAGYVVSTWYDLHRTLYLVMRIERWSAYILLSLIVLVATFNMLGSLSMAVIEKRREIAVLKAMGMSAKRIVRLFMVEGVLIGAAGTLAGIGLGLLILYLQVHFQLFRLDTSIYIIPAIPVEIHFADFLTVALSSLGLSSLAAYYPARRAASTVPAQALRWE